MRLALIGGEEFSDGFEDVHAALHEQARNGHGPGRPVRAVFLPTCAAKDGPQVVEHWCEQARQRLGALGAEVFAPLLMDTQGANDSTTAEKVAGADWIYLGGGFPHIGLDILRGSAVWEAIFLAAQRGALLSGASAGAMMMCSKAWVITPELDEAVEQIISTEKSPGEVQAPVPPFVEGMGLIPASLCWPHLNMFFSWEWLQAGLLPPETTLLGLDEQTALMLENGGPGKVLGRGRVLIVRPDRSSQEARAGELIQV